MDSRIVETRSHAPDRDEQDEIIQADSVKAAMIWNESEKFEERLVSDGWLERAVVAVACQGESHRFATN